VVDTETLIEGIDKPTSFSAKTASPAVPYEFPAHNEGSGVVADVVLAQPEKYINKVVAPPFRPIFPQTSQSPAVNEIDVISLLVLLVQLTALATAITLLIYSPTLPAAALLFVVVPIIPEVELKVTLVALAAPNTGVINVGEVEKTKLVDVVPVAPAAVYPVILLKAVMLALLAFVPPFATGNTPVTPVVNGNPVHELNTPLVGVPKAGVTNVGDVAPTKVPEPVEPLSPFPTEFIVVMFNP